MFLVFFVFASLAIGSQAQSPNAAQVFKAKGQAAFTVLSNVEINGTTYFRINVFVTRDVNTSSTRLMLVAFEGNPINNNVTRNNITGTIPDSDFTLAPDLSSANLSTVINTVGNQFNNTRVGPISNLAISLNWTAEAIGTLVDTFVINVTPVGSADGFRETFHQNGPHAEGVVTGTVDDGNDGVNVNTINSFGSLDSNRSIDIFKVR